MMFPGLLMTLLDKCGISPDKRVTAHPFFGPSAQTRFEDTLHLSHREGERVCVCARVCVCVCALMCVLRARLYVHTDLFVVVYGSSSIVGPVV